MNRGENLKKAIEVIAEHIEKKGYAPSMRSVAKGVGVSVSTAWSYLHELRESGEVEFDDHTPRSLRLK